MSYRNRTAAGIEAEKARSRKRMARVKAEKPAVLKARQKSTYLNRKARAIKVLGGKCAICGSTKELMLDHIKPLNLNAVERAAAKIAPAQEWARAARGNTDNLQLLCRPHHL